MQDVSTLIRRVEALVLDREYLRYSVLSLPEDLAILRLLKMTGDILRSFRGSLGE
jgi:hypothetical protein